jgi:hypothetical protein
MSVMTETAYSFDINKTDIHGFVSQGFMVSDRNNYYTETEDGSFQFNEMGINFSNQITERLRVGVQFFARDLGKIGNNEPAVDWAVADYRWQDWLGLRAGRIKNRYGFYGYTRDADMLRTSILLPQSVYFESLRESTNSLDGAGIYGYVPVGDSDSIDYQINYGKQVIDTKVGGVDDFIENHIPVDITDFESQELLLISVEWNTRIKGLRLGGTMAFSEFEADALTTSNPILRAYGIPPNMNVSFDANDAEVTVFSAQYVWNDLVFDAEYFGFKADAVIAEAIGQKIDGEGYYAGISYRFAEWFEAGAYYSEAYFDKSDKEGKGYEMMGKPNYLAWQKEFVLSTRFDIGENWTLKAEGHFINGAEMMFLADNPEGLDENSFMFAMKATFSF